MDEETKETILRLVDEAVSPSRMSASEALDAMEDLADALACRIDALREDVERAE